MPKRSFDSLPGDHGDAWYEMQVAICTKQLDRPVQGCRLIDETRRITNVEAGNPHRDALIEVARNVGKKACDGCPFPDYAKVPTTNEATSHPIE